MNTEERVLHRNRRGPSTEMVLTLFSGPKDELTLTLARYIIAKDEAGPLVDVAVAYIDKQDLLA